MISRPLVVAHVEQGFPVLIRDGADYQPSDSGCGLAIQDKLAVPRIGLDHDVVHGARTAVGVDAGLS